MKKLYFLLLTVLISGLSFGQVIITELADPNNDALARYVELYNVGVSDFDLTGWELRRWTNGNATTTSTVDLSPVGTLSSGSYVTVAADAAQFQAVYGFAPNIDAGTGGPADSNGDDQIGLFDDQGTLIDIFGVPGEDGTGTCHEFENGRAERNASVTVPVATWNEAEWNIWADSATSGTCTNYIVAPQDAPGIFDPGTWVGDPNSCGVLLSTESYICSTNTVGDNNDGVIIEIPYTGSDAGITSVTTSSSGNVAGSDPASDVDGTIVITGLSEGDAWDITLNGGDCDATTISGTVPADHCDPAPNTCFDISNGAELFEMVTVTPNSDGDEWTYATGTYSMNGFVGGGQEQVETWLIFGPLDMTSVTDLSLMFDAAEQFGVTDLAVAYTDSYSGCPSSSTWTTAQTISTAGAIEVDLSAASGTDVFIGIQYVDDGADGYSGWDLSNVALAAYGSCPTLGTRPTSNCAVCDMVLSTENYVCGTNTAGANNDTVTIEIPYSGSENTLTSVTTTSGGTVGGDDPATVADGTITITGLSEGDAWDLTLNGGDCDGTTISGTVGSTICDPVTCANPGDIIFTEIMQNPGAAADPAGEYVELYNTTGSPIDIQGWTIKDEATTSETHTISTSLVVPAMGYIVIGNASTTTPVLDYDYGNDISLGNGTDGVILECSSTVIDQVIWDNGATFPDPSGASMELSTTAYNSTDNDNGANWGTATSDIGNGDLGTPGAINDYTLSNESFDTVKFSIYPNPTSTGSVNIVSTNSAPIQVKVFDILGKQVKNETINSTLNVSGLKSGIYILNITQEGHSVTKKLVID